jgi:hypothetical protein
LEDPDTSVHSAKEGKTVWNSGGLRNEHYHSKRAYISRRVHVSIDN